MADSPSGEPIATTGWPTARSAELPRVAGVRPETPSAVITARSSVAVVPTTVAVAVVPSLNRTSQVGGALDDVVVGQDEAVGASG